MISAVILAAGESRRMGGIKLLLPFGEKTIIETVADSALQSKLDNVLVILGSSAKKISEKIRDMPVEISVNPNFSRGMLSSILWGFRHLPDSTDAVLIMLGDQPMVSSSVIDAIINGYSETEKGIILPVYNKKRGHPVLIDVKYSDDLKRLDPEKGLRELMHKYTGDIMEVHVNTPTILRDIDTPEDYSEEIKYRR
ncbi:NTP transferase domain-containing protein [Candidatus Poribacteria bacterium]|nr:NTP transferase domain-containing protein [Candidatus Poribacteria bacterium]